MDKNALIGVPQFTER